MMALYKHIIVPLDGSELSAQALPATRMLAQAAGARITLVRSFTAAPGWQVNAERGRYSGALANAEHDRIAAYLLTEKRQLEKFGVSWPIDTLVREGAPVGVITRLAAEHPEALIVMSTHGRGGFSRLMMGSVTSRVVGGVQNPVFTVRCNDDETPVPMESIDHIIVPLDGSKFAERALDHAAAMAQLFGARMTLCQSTHGADYFSDRTDWTRLDGEGGLHFGGPAALSERLSELSVDYLHRIARRLEARFGITGVRLVNTHAAAPDAIAELAREPAQSLVVMTTHGRSGVGRALLGSVADRVVRHSPAPTLLVRGPLAAGFGATAAVEVNRRETPALRREPALAGV